MPEPDDCERTGRRRQRRSTWGDLLAKPGAWREARYCLRAARLGEAERPGPPQPQTNTLDRYLQLPAAPPSDLREVEATAPAAPEAPPPPPDSCGGAAPGAAAQPQAQQPLRDFTAACWATLDELDLLEEFKLDCPTLRYVPKSARAATADATEERCAPCAAGQTASKRNALGSSYCSGNACSSSRRCASARAAAVLTTNAWTWAGPCASE